jgi:hypothetical protein
MDRVGPKRKKTFLHVTTEPEKSKFTQKLPDIVQNQVCQNWRGSQEVHNRDNHFYMCLYIENVLKFLLKSHIDRKKFKLILKLPNIGHNQVV